MTDTTVSNWDYDKDNPETADLSFLLSKLEEAIEKSSSINGLDQTWYIVLPLEFYQKFKLEIDKAMEK